MKERRSFFLEKSAAGIGDLDGDEEGQVDGDDEAV
eukprot:CAMPEP_0198202498 /NCGR_PEP_ID=MMETSP1445-20131203/5668_1 /TAXON_ID=36898 /ORGANISM="Pyramimonas sp., Strain CCMP2087" /LENGTH=34 /DNA_ID= /DNA_START= /DNA_END= /DNA_ORIENTATION=